MLSLGDRLGPVVWRFEAGTKIDRDGLAGFIASLPATLDGRALRHVLDLREPALATADVIALSRQQRIATVFTDSSEHPSSADITTDFVYARVMRSRARVVTQPARWMRGRRVCAPGPMVADPMTCRASIQRTSHQSSHVTSLSISSRPTSNAIQPLRWD